jgi:hypothetical protein
MKVWAQFYGGSSYSPGDYEEFSSIKAVVAAYGDALRGDDPEFPCVSDEAQVLLFATDPDEEGDPYPFLTLYAGPRGGIKREIVL